MSHHRPRSNLRLAPHVSHAGVTILYLVLVLAMTLGGLHLSWLRSTRAQWLAASELESFGAEVTWAWRLDDQIHERRYPVYEPPSFVLPGDSFVASVHLLFCSDPQLNEKLAALDRLPSLRCLALTNSRVDEATFRHLAGLSRLEWLDLHDTPLTDAALRRLSAFHSLEWLNLQNTRITDASVPHLARFKRLKRLNLGGTGVTPVGLRLLKAHFPDAEIRSRLPPLQSSVALGRSEMIF